MVYKHQTSEWYIHKYINGVIFASYIVKEHRNQFSFKGFVLVKHSIFDMEAGSLVLFHVHIYPFTTARSKVCFFVRLDQSSADENSL